MNLRSTVVLAALALAAPLAAQKLTPMDEAGYRRLIASNRGTVLIVDFWATWCAPCRAEMPQLANLDSKYRARGLKLVTISADEPEAEAQAAAFLKKSGVGGPAYIKRAADDDKFINSVDPKWSGALPALFVYDRQGRLAKSFIGETATSDLDALLGKLVR